MSVSRFPSHTSRKIGLLNKGELWQDPAEKAKAMESGSGHDALKEAVEEFFADLPSSFLQTVVLSSMDSWFHLFHALQQQPVMSSWCRGRI